MELLVKGKTLMMIRTTARRENWKMMRLETTRSRRRVLLGMNTIRKTRPMTIRMMRPKLRLNLQVEILKSRCRIRICRNFLMARSSLAASTKTAAANGAKVARICTSISQSSQRSTASTS